GSLTSLTHELSILEVELNGWGFDRQEEEPDSSPSEASPDTSRYKSTGLESKSAGLGQLDPVRTSDPDDEVVGPDVGELLKIVLTPIDPTTTPPKSTLSLSTLLKYEQHEYHSAKEFILLGLDEEDNKPHPNTDPLVQSLLKSYSHVFPTEIPPGSPPMRSIQHKIDLIPGSALPNKPAYRTNPQETTEIRKHMDCNRKDLIRKKP
ncbi:hypothetical protein Tco_0611199, partial [Tanacetum coccineum]